MTGRDLSDKKQAVEKWKLTIQMLNYILISKISVKCDENIKRAKVIEVKEIFYILNQGCFYFFINKRQLSLVSATLQVRGARTHYLSCIPRYWLLCGSRSPPWAPKPCHCPDCQMSSFWISAPLPCWKSAVCAGWGAAMLTLWELCFFAMSEMLILGVFETCFFLFLKATLTLFSHPLSISFFFFSLS